MTFHSVSCVTQMKQTSVTLVIVKPFGRIKPNVRPDNKNILKNYRPISLLPVCGKIFEKCIYNSLYSYLESNDILSKSQSGFHKGDSCISQLLAITHEIYSNFDACPSLETRGVFLDISKAFDRVWHAGLLHKIKSYGINGPLLILIKSFLTNFFIWERCPNDTLQPLTLTTLQC